MHRTHSLNKIVWATDIFEKPDFQKHTTSFLKTLAEITHAKIIPVYVLNPLPISSPSREVPALDLSLQPKAEAQLENIARQSEIPTMQRGVVLIETDNSMRHAANKVIEYAKDQNTDAIVVATHGRKGLSRFLLGSFAETLLLQSTVPVITVNPGAHVPQKINHILFPTDYSQPSRRGFEHTVVLAKSFGAKITLLYKTPPLVLEPYLLAPHVYDYFEEESKNRKTLAEGWMDWAQKNGVSATAHFDPKPGNIEQAITDYAANQNVDLIAMVTQVGPVSSVVMGSVTRKVIRNVHCPVWVRHASAT